MLLDCYARDLEVEWRLRIGEPECAVSLVNWSDVTTMHVWEKSIIIFFFIYKRNSLVDSSV